MNKSTKFFISMTYGIILCLATCGCARSTPATTEPISEVIAVETLSDQVPANVVLGDDWCYFRFNLTRDHLEEIAKTISTHTNEEISLSLPGCTPDNDAFYINITYADIEKSLHLLDKYPEQQSVNLIKEMPIEALDGIEKPEANLLFVYYLLTENDITRMLNGLQESNASTVILRQRLNIQNDDIAEFELAGPVLVQCYKLLRESNHPYVIYICQVEAPQII